MVLQILKIPGRENVIIEKIILKNESEIILVLRIKKIELTFLGHNWRMMVWKM